MEKLIKRNDFFLKSSESDLEFTLNCRSLTNDPDKLIKRDDDFSLFSFPFFSKKKLARAIWNSSYVFKSRRRLSELKGKVVKNGAIIFLFSLFKNTKTGLYSKFHLKFYSSGQCKIKSSNQNRFRVWKDYSNVGKG